LRIVKEIHMLGKIIGAIAGKRAAHHVSGINGTGGALLGVGAAALLRRLGPIGLVAAAAGGYALKRHYEKRQAVGPAVQS
jgi:hypothetical protein